MAYRDNKELSDIEALKWDWLRKSAEDLAESGELLGSAVGHIPWLILAENYDHLSADDIVSMACGMAALLLGLGLER